MDGGSDIPSTNFALEIRDKNDPLWIKKTGKLILLDSLCRGFVGTPFVSSDRMKILGIVQICVEKFNGQN